MSAFLWKGASLASSGAKVAWASLCYPQKEGGLGIMRLKDWNRAATFRHIWRLLSDESSIWPSWVRSELVRGRSFWQLRTPSTASWVWRKILHLRTLCRGLMVSRIGDGRDTSLWQDYWLPQGPLCDMLPYRTLLSTGLPADARVADIIVGDSWAFPPSPPPLQDIWNSITLLPRALLRDRLVWKGSLSGSFSIRSAWEILRPRRAPDPLYHAIWFRERIPRHSFISWLAAKGRLSTMDRLSSHGVVASDRCILCSEERETHSHLFFDCQFSASIWREISGRVGVSWPSHSWFDLLQWTSAHLHRRGNFTHVLARLVLSASVYFIWYERNNRAFQQVHRTSRVIIDDIFCTVRDRISEFIGAFEVPPHLAAIWSLRQ